MGGEDRGIVGQWSYKIKGKLRFVIKTISSVSHIYYLYNFLEVE